MTVTISNPKLSFLQKITAIHFPVSGLPLTPGQVVYLVEGPDGGGTTAYKGHQFPYGSACADYGVGGGLLAPPLTAFKRNGLFRYGGGSRNTATGLSAVMTWVELTVIGPLSFAGGFYVDPNIANLCAAEPINAGLFHVVPFKFS